MHRKSRFPAAQKEPLCVDSSEELDHFGNQSSPTGLMARPQARSVVSMEVLVKQQVVFPVWICLEPMGSTVNRPPCMLVSQEDSDQPIRNLSGYVKKIHPATRPSGTFDFKVIAIVEVKRQQSTDYQGVHGHPHGTAPV